MRADLKIIQVLVYCLLVGVEWCFCNDDFFIVNKYVGSQYYCITNSSAALSWILEDTTLTKDLQQVSKFLPTSQNFWTLDCRDFKPHDWLCQNVISDEIILDRRWEGIQIYKTDYVENETDTNSTLIFTPVGTTLSNNFQIALSIRTNEEAHIFLCESAYVANSNCYWLILQGFKGTKSAIRKCPAKTIFLDNGKLPAETCKTFKTFIEHSSDATKFLSNKTWNHFILSQDGNRLTFAKQNGEEILSYGDQDGPTYQTKKIIIHSKKTTGLWKIHELNTFRTTEKGVTEFKTPIYSINGSICVSMFVRMCDKCQMFLELANVSNKNMVFERQTYNTTQQPARWSEIKFCSDNITTEKALFSITTVYTGDSTPYWVISDVKQYQDHGFRMIQLDDMANCQLMAPKTEVITLNEKVLMTSSSKSDFDHCPEETVSKHCIPCEWFLNRNCEVLKICEKYSEAFRCSCSAGYLRDQFEINCVTPCPKRTYGYECKKQCSEYCSGCKHVAGTCSSCLGNYKGARCDIPPIPIFKYAPIVRQPSYTEATIVVNNFDVLISSSNAASHDTFTIQHKRIENGSLPWITFPEHYEIGKEKSITIKDLEPGTKYKVRSVFSRDKDYDSEEIPSKEFTTRCDDVRAEDLVLEISQTTVNVTVLEERKRFICNFNPSQIRIKPISSSIKKTTHSEAFTTHLSGLTPYHNYTAKITVGTGNSPIIKSFRTAEGIPEEVKNLFGKPISDTAIELNWERPGKINGDLAHYVVKYQILQYLSCDATLEAYGSETTVRSTTTSTTLSSLNPYTKYIFSVSVKNTKYEGNQTSISVNTAQSDTISEYEIPEVESKTIESRNVKLQFQKIGCNKFHGSLSIMITVTCSDRWCSKNKTEELEYRGLGDVKSIGVLPFTNYVLMLEFCRNKTKCSPITKHVTFRSDVDPPNGVTNISVYSKNTNSISVRWQPPEPPSGILELYNIKVMLTDFNHNVTDTPCILWPDFQCFTLTGLKADRKYSVEIHAKNEKPDALGLLKTVESVTRTEQSKPPAGLKIFWTLKNDLRITWKHPTEANGDISHFNISVVNSVLNQKEQIRETLSVTKEQYSPEYHYVVPATRLENSIEYRIRVGAFNGLDGETSVLNDFSPPEIPIFEKEPERKTSNRSIEIKTYKIRNSSNKTNSYKLFLLVSDEKLETVSHPAELQQFRKTFDIQLSNFRSIYECSQYKNMERFLIGESNNSTSSCKTDSRLALTAGTHYNVTILLINTEGNKSSYNLYTYDLFTAGQAPEVAKDLTLLALLALLLIIPIAIIIFLKRRPIIEKLTSIKKTTCMSSPNDAEVPEEEEETPLATVPAMPKTTKKVHSKRIKIADLEEYVKGALQSGELERQHALFPRGQTKPWECGASKENKGKNRYANLVAYDHTRVILEQTGADPHSDYINANYLDGYKVPKAYIATQGPKLSTTRDFWKMIWQENVRHIAMLANLYEGGKKKVEKYWPDTNETLIFGDISVHYTSSQVYADYEHRVFQVENSKVSRELHQYHFSSWPDHGVPLYSQSLVPFLQTLQAVPLDSKSPIVVHCSAGVGRTGTILLCDSCLRMAAKEKAVDVLKIIQKLRDQRPNMVDNVQQYKLAHLVILEYLLGMKTGIPCDGIGSKVKILLESGEVGKQLRYLDKTAWQDQTMKSAVKKQDVFVVKEKNRFQEITPESQGYIYLSRHPPTDDSSTYINAVHVDGFQNPNRFIVTQQPMPNTLGDFWRLVHEHDVSVIISLNEIDLKNKTSCPFWPSQSADLKPVDSITLKHANTLSLDFHDLISVHMYADEDDQCRTVEILTFKNWPANSDRPKSVEAFLSFYEGSNIAARQSKPVIITCFDGALASGLYVALSFVIEKMKLEQICDVCQAVRSIRHNRSQFVRNEKQLEFLYQAAVAYINGFQSYANFN